MCMSSRGVQAHRVNPVIREAKSTTYNMLNQNWLSVGCECVLYIFSLYVSKLALNMFSLWQIYYNKYTFYMQIEACNLQIFVGFRGASPPWPPNQGEEPWTWPGGYRPLDPLLLFGLTKCWHLCSNHLPRVSPQIYRLSSIPRSDVPIIADNRLSLDYC